MPGLLVGIFLIGSLLLVHFSLRSQPLPQDEPLDVDEGLPWPEAGQASTVFSLTALFGAYFGITLLLGLPALIGLGFGTALGLVIIRHWIDARKPGRFEPFLFGMLEGSHRNALIYALVVSGLQFAYATSELLILREIARVSLGAKPEQATILAVGVAIIGYFYVLFGGYMAVFRTDVVQFVMVTAMAVIFGIVLLGPERPMVWTALTVPRSGYWTLTFVDSRLLLYLYHFAIATVMAIGLLAASPDAWKRVFMVSRKKNNATVRFTTFLIVGVVPYLMLLPFALAIGSIPDGPVDTGQIFSSLLKGNVIFIAAALGLVASFLSSFNSAILAGVHVALMFRRTRSFLVPEISRFHWLMVAALLTVFFLFRSLVSFSNPYILGNLLLGPYALVAGIQIGTRGGDISSLPENSLTWIAVIGLVGWFVYFVSSGIPHVPTTYQINSVPAGVLFFFLALLACRILMKGGPRHGRHSDSVEPT